MLEKKVVMGVLLMAVTLPRVRCPFSRSLAVNHLGVMSCVVLITSGVMRSRSRCGTVSVCRGGQRLTTPIIREQALCPDRRNRDRDQAADASRDYRQWSSNEPR